MPRHVLVLSTEPLTGDDLRDRIAGDFGGGDGEVEVDLVIPALAGSQFAHAMGDVDEGRERAEEAIEASPGDNVAHAEVGDSDPLLAIEDALNRRPADEIVIVTRAGDSARWLEGNLFDRARERFAQPIHHIEVDAESHRVVDEERKGAGVEPSDDAEVEGQSKNTPRFSVRDLAGIAVAVVGTIAAIAIAATCDGDVVQRDAGIDGVGSDGSCVLAYIVAGVTALVNAAHVVGLMLFESVGYRGGWARVFSSLSLIGTPIAVVIVAIAAH